MGGCDKQIHVISRPTNKIDFQNGQVNQGLLRGMKDGKDTILFRSPEFRVLRVQRLPSRIDS